MNTIVNKIKKASNVVVRLERSEVMQCLNEYIERVSGLKNVEYSFSRMGEECDDLVVTFKDDEIEDRFFNSENADYVGVEDGDCGRLLVAEAIACNFELTYCDIAVWVEFASCDYINVEVPVAILEPSDESYVLLSCDQWKTHSSARISGVYTNQDVLKQKVIDMFTNEEINWRGQSVIDLENEIKQENDDDISSEELSTFMDDAIDSVKAEIRNSSVRDMDSNIEYAMIQVYNTNK